MVNRNDGPYVTDYNMSIHFGVCSGPVDTIRKIWVGEKVVWEGEIATETDIDIDARDIFGGDDGEGGVLGRARFYPGAADQVLTDDHAARLDATLTGATAPGFRGLASLFFTELPGTDEGDKFPGTRWATNNPYLKPLWVTVSRSSPALSEDNATIYRGSRTKRSVYFSLDRSGSMGDATPGGSTRLAVLKAAMVSILTQIRSRVEGGLEIDIGISRWSVSSTTAEYTNATAGNITTLISFVNGMTALGDTDFDVAANDMEAWWTSSLADDTIGARVNFFFTDGLPEGGGDGASASAILGSLLTDGDVEFYAFNLNLTDTSETAFLDNTAADGVPVIEDDDQSGITTAVTAALFGDDIEFDSNPAHIIYECLVNDVWGMGAAASQVDTDSFTAAAATLAADTFGLSMMWVQQSSIEDFIREVLDHIEGVLYIAPTTGKITLKLIRDDYDEETLREVNPDNARMLSWSRKLPGELINEMNVTWTNPLNEQEEVVTVQDFGGIAAQGTVVSDSRNYYGIRTRQLAMKVAQRDLRAASMPLASCEVECDRSFWDIAPGDCVILNSPEDGIEAITMRVLTIDYGKPGDSTIRMSLVEDVFGKPIQEYDEPPETEWQNPTTDPTVMTYALALTLPWYFAAIQIASANLNDSDYPDSYGAVLAAHIDTTVGDYELWADNGGIYQNVGTLGTLRRGLLGTALVKEVTSSVAGMTGLTAGPPPSAGSFLFIGTDTSFELAYVTAFDGTTATVTRAVLDTIPQAWPIGTPVYVVDGQYITDATIRADTEAVSYKLRTKTGNGILALGVAPIVTTTLTERPFAPYRPANVQVNGDNGFAGTVNAYLSSPPDVVLTFATRNRLTEDTTILEWDDGAVTGEAGQTTTVRMYDDESNTLLETYTSVTSPYTVPSVDYAGYTRIRLEVSAVRDGIESIQAYPIVVAVAETEYLLKEDGSALLKQDGDNLKTEG